MPKDKGGGPTKIKVTARRRKNVTISGVTYDEIPANMDRAKPPMKGFKQVMPTQHQSTSHTLTWLPPKPRAVHKR